MNEQIEFEKSEVYIHEKPIEEDINGPLIEHDKIGGRLQIVKNRYSIFIRFLPQGLEANEACDEWTLVMNSSVLSYSKDTQNETCTIENKKNLSKHKYQFDIHELSSVRRIYQGYGIPCIVFMLLDGRFLPDFYFYKGGSKEFLCKLKQYLIFKKDILDPRLWSVQPQNGEKFRQSLYELSLFNEERENVMKKFLNEPVQSTLLGFSKVTNILRDVIKPTDSSFKSQFYTHDLKIDSQETTDDMSDLLDSLIEENIHSTQNDGYEMVTKVDLGPMPNVERGEPLKKEDIKFDNDGRVLNPEKLKEIIFRGGVEKNLRKFIWKFLLNYFEWDSTEQSRAEKRKKRFDDYYRMKQQWQTITEEQKVKFSILRERETLIEKDVQRTDRNHTRFKDDDSKDLLQMNHILMTYNMLNFDLGYVQGMSDLLAPIMVVMENEVDSFWCFAGFMDKIELNFQMDQLDIKFQLNNLKLLIEFFDSKFSDYLERNDSSNMYFCFRWILILFKREFSFKEINRMWEVIWTDLPCKNFHLLISISILLMKKDDIMSNNYGFSEILKFINDLSGRIDLEKTLQYAEGLYLQLKNFQNVPNNICEIVGLPLNANKELEETQSKLLSTDFSEENNKLTPTSSYHSIIRKNQDSVEILDH